MRRHIIVALLLVVCTCTSSAFWFDNPLKRFENDIAHAPYFKCICLQNSRKITFLTCWEAKGKDLSSEMNIWIGRNKVYEKDKVEVKFGVFYIYNFKKGEVLTVDYSRLVGGKPYRDVSKGKFRDFIMRDWPWTNLPGRFLIQAKNAKNVKTTGTREFLGRKWQAFCGEYILDSPILTDNDPKITFEILVSPNQKSWLEIYRRKDGSVIAAREGAIDDKRNPVNQNPPGSQTKLLERYLQKYHESYIPKIMELPME